MVLNPTDYLTSHGWTGPGSGFTPTSRSKPITVIQKKNQFGVGKDRDTSYPWWDDVFTKIASKIGAEKQTDRPELGIETSQPARLHENTSNLNLEVIQEAKKNAVRQELYRRFFRGATIIGTVQDEIDEQASEEKLTNLTNNQTKMDSNKDKKRRRKSDQKLKEEPSTSKKKHKSKSQSQVEKKDSLLSQTLEKSKIPQNSVENESEKLSPVTEQKEAVIDSNEKKRRRKSDREKQEELLSTPKKKRKSKLNSQVKTQNSLSQTETSADEKTIQSSTHLENHISPRRPKKHKKKRKDSQNSPQ